MWTRPALPVPATVEPSATIAVVIHYRSLTVCLLGAWLGASVLADVAVTQNFQAVDRFLPTSGIDQTSRASQRVLMRRNAADENAVIFLNWERAEFVVGGVLLLLSLKTGAARMEIAGIILLLVILAVEHWLLTPRIISLGGSVDGLAPGDSQYRTFWMLHGFYSGLDILKMIIVFALAARAVLTRRQGSAVPEMTLHGVRRG
jgi:hypothetical protein